MADFGKINEFRKTTQLRKINEDPTYLSFFFLFNFYDHESSPLLSGAASDYLRNVVGDTERADRLDRFKKLLQKINTELPWFWQSVSGLEATRTYGSMEDPWWGANKPKLEIECLENIELTSFALIDLYKRAAYDFNRWVQVIPENLRHFEVTIFVTEVRAFQQTREASILNSKLNNTSNISSETAKKSPATEAVNIEMAVDAKPIVVTKLGFCEFDIDSTADLFTSLTKNPEMAKSKINIFWKTSEQVKQLYGQNLNSNEGNSLVLESKKDPRFAALYGNENSPFDPLDYAKGALNNKIEEVKGNFTANVNNLLGGLPGGNGGLGNAYGQLLGGQLGQLAQSIGESITARLLLGNVHGLNTASTVQDAINAGSINGILNAAGQLAGGLGSLFGNNDDSSNISPKKIYPENAIDSSQGPINEKVYEPGVDSTPDGNLNQNVYE